MRIYLFLGDKIESFSLPTVVSGSFSFDVDGDEESKLLNIESRDSQWVLYSTTETSIIDGSSMVTDVPLVSNKYYVLKRNDVTYLIYVSDSYDNSFVTYSHNNQMNVVIGNSEECNVRFECEFFSGAVINIFYKDNVSLLKINPQCCVYVNRVRVTSEISIIHVGDTISLFGLRVIFLDKLLLINNPMGNVNVNAQSSGLNEVSLASNDKPIDIDVKDIDLYNKEDYYSKSPRVRRVIKTKKIEFSKPPKPQGASELPLILTIGPMMTSGIVSIVMISDTLSGLLDGSTKIENVWPRLITSSVMLLSIFLWPSLTRRFNKKLREKKNKELNEKYTAYLQTKRQEFIEESNLQKSILIENLITLEECIERIKVGKINFWDKRIEQSDFLEVRIGKGNELLDVSISYPEDGFTIDESELEKKADKLVEEFKYINDVPIGYSLYESRITAIMGNKEKGYGLVNNIILQLLTFYSYEDVKLVIFTDKENREKWNYVKYLKHAFSNDLSVRFFASDLEDSKRIGDFLNYEIQNRVSASSQEGVHFKPHYIVICDNYSMIKRLSFIKNLTEMDANLGFSMIIIEESMSKLPSKCSNFIMLGEKSSGVLKNSYDEQEQSVFYDEINYSINMLNIAKRLSNIPIEFQEGSAAMPDAISFLEMEKVGKVEQLNILNRWNTNDSTNSLRTEIGVDEENNLLYLDLHEKFHGPHGLIAGTTGSGKSEFIITYILSMCINYSPDDVAFILIDYKGGGLALAFENRTTGVVLPHLAGTITNLDKSEMDRTLVSIDSESKRRQNLFNKARDELGESTMDIYKYQRFYKEGRLSEPIPHLFIICDEFAELKAQQPDFMSNLISIARIGRSLGIHLILATQKPSGVVNDQIWSNSKFRVCLKVQTDSDSKEMIKRSDAARLKQAGRFYLQVGYDEYYVLGQSAWCGAKYYPSDKVVKQVDKSVNFIDETGNFIKSIQAGTSTKKVAEGEQIAAIMKNVIETAKQVNKKTRRLWLNDIDPIILVDNLIKKYEIKPIPYDVKAIVGEYDAPEKQEQGLLEYSYKKDGSTIIYSNDEVEREKIISTIIYSTCICHSSSEVNIYIIDFGSESLKMFERFPQVGGVACIGEDERIDNLLKLISKLLKDRKKLLTSYSGSIDYYNQKSENKIPQILLILNGYENILESYRDLPEYLSSVGRDSERYGINIMISCLTPAAIGSRLKRFLGNVYALHIADSSEYYSAFNVRCRIKPRSSVGRGLANNGGIHEFQTASIVGDDGNIIEYFETITKKLNNMNVSVAPPIPQLPEVVTFDRVFEKNFTIEKVPIGMYKESLKIARINFAQFPSTVITCKNIGGVSSFIDSLMDILLRINGVVVFFIDVLQDKVEFANKQINGRRVNYVNNNFLVAINKLIEIENDERNNQYRFLYFFYGIGKLKSKIDSTKEIDELFKSIKNNEHSNIIICDDIKGVKTVDLDSWYTPIKNSSDGIFIGKGFNDQNVFRVNRITKDMSVKRGNDYAYYVKENEAELIKVIQFGDVLNQEDDEDEE